MDPKQKKKLVLLKNLLVEGPAALVDPLVATQEALEAIQANPPKDGVDGENGKDGVNPDPAEVVQTVIQQLPPIVIPDTVTVSNLGDIVIPATEPTDLSPVTEGLDDVKKAIKGIKIPALPKLDLHNEKNPVEVHLSEEQLGKIYRSGLPIGGSGTKTYTDGETATKPRGVQIMYNASGTERHVSTAQPLPVTIISGGAGGTEYADGAVRGTSTGTLAMGDDGTNIQSIKVNAAGELQVDVLTMPTVAVTGTFWQATQPVSGTVTANAGTNLNTSLLALEAGNLATIAAKDFATQTTLALIKAKTDNIPALGQALAAASVPVVLTAAQLTTLTPPAAITNYALETGGNLATIAGKDFATQTTLSAINAKLVSGTDIGDVTINNAAGAAAVNIQDGGNSITVDGTVAFSNSTIAVTNAGTFAVQENGAALTALQLIDNAVSGAGFNITQQGGVAVSLNTGVRDAGTQRVTIATNDVVPVSQSGAWSLSANQSVNVAQMNGVTVTMGNGASGTGVQRVTIANDSTGILAGVTTVTNITNWGNVVDDAAFTPATTRVLAVGYFADETSTDAVDEGDMGAARMTLNRKQITASQMVDDAAWVAGGYTSIMGGWVDDASTDLADEGDAAAIRVSPQRHQYSVNAFGVRVVGTVDLTSASTTYRITTSATRVSNFWLQAKQSNTGTVTWGHSATYATNTMELRPGQMIYLGDIDISLLYFGPTIAGDDINYSYTTV